MRVPGAATSGLSTFGSPSGPRELVELTKSCQASSVWRDAG
jgi:hypothetical protein